jgi:glutamyl-tRNA synthetase
VQPQAIRSSLLEIGMSSVDVTFSPEQIYSVNRRLVDSDANRYFLTVQPLVATINNIPLDVHIAYPLIHPEFPDRGTRVIQINAKDETVQVNLPGMDLDPVKKGSIIRLKDLMNVSVQSKTKKGIKATFHSTDVETARINNAPMLQWTPVDRNTPVNILMPSGTNIHGFAEPDLRKVQTGEIIQFERFAFCRIESVNSSVNAIWLHR